MSSIVSSLFIPIKMHRPFPMLLIISPLTEKLFYDSINRE